jgi:hypothetical protein
MFSTTNNKELPRTAPEVVPFIAEFRGLKMPIPSWVVETIEILCEEGNPSFDNVKLGKSTAIYNQ